MVAELVLSHPDTDQITLLKSMALTNKINYHIGEIQFDNREYIYPGETALVTVIFLKLGSIERFLIPGQKWFVYEGARLVAEGEILYLIEKL